MGKIATRQAYGEELAELIVKDPNILVMTADLAGSNKTDLAAKACPERHFDLGIAEGNMMAVAAGMAACGKTVFASTFAIFAAGRAYEQIRNSIAYPHLNVKVCATHAGISVGEDGASHQSITDLALMRGLPGLTVIQPSDGIETREVIKWAANYKGPVYVRLGRSTVEDVHGEGWQFDPRKAEILKDGKDTVLIATGLEVQESLKAAELLKEKGIDAAVANVAVLKPLDTKTISSLIKKYAKVYTVEEHSIIGGLGSAVAEVIAEEGGARLVRIGLNDTFGESGTPAGLLAKYGLNAEKIADRVMLGK